MHAKLQSVDCCCGFHSVGSQLRRYKQTIIKLCWKCLCWNPSLIVDESPSETHTKQIVPFECWPRQTPEYWVRISTFQENGKKLIKKN